MRKLTNRAILLLMVLALVVSVLPAAVLATGETESPFEGWSLTLGDNIGVNFYLAKDAAYTANVTVDGVEANYVQTETDDNYILNVKVAAAQMTDTIALTVKNSEAVVHTGEYSVRQYAETILQGNYDDGVKQMVLQMLNYGAAAQEYFGYKTTSPANDGYELESQADVTAEVPAIAPEGSAEGVTLYGMSLVFESKTAVRFYFTGDVSGHEFKANDTVLTPVSKNSMHYVEVANINPQDLDKAVTVTVDGTLSVSYSPMNYIVRKYNGNSTDALKALVQAMYGYHLEAQDYQKIVDATEIELPAIYDMNVAGNDLVVSNVALNGNLVSVSVQGTEISLADATLKNNTLTIPAASFQQDTMPSGNLTLDIATDTKTVAVSGEFVWVINNDTELLAMKSHLTTEDNAIYTGSLALGADITKAVTFGANNGLFTTSETFDGTFDGRMHSIDSLTVKGANIGLFTNVSGKICNLKVNSATVTTNTAPLVGRIMTGTFENVYVKGSITGDGMGASSNLNNFGCGLLAGRYQNSAKVKNVIVEVVSIADDLRLATAFGKLGNYNSMNWTSFQNCYAVNADGQAYMTYATTPEKVSFTQETTGQFAAMAELWANEEAAALAAKLELEKPTEQITLDAPFDMNVADNDLELSVAAEPKSITVQGTDIALTGTWADGKLTIPAEQFMLDAMPTGALTLEIVTAGCDYEITGEFVWVINTQDELYAMKSHLVVADDGKTYTGSLALGADIDPGSGYLTINNNKKIFESADVFAGTFDGRGHTLYKVFAQIGKNGLFANVSGTIKNLKLENAYVKGATGALVGNILTGTVENVYIIGTIQDDGLTTSQAWTYQGCGLLAGQIQKGTAISNCIVEVVEIKEAALEVGTAFGKLNGMTEEVFENCYAINASGAAYMIKDGTSGTKHDFALAVNGNYASFEDLWFDEESAARKLAEETFLLPAPERGSASITMAESYDMNVADKNFVLENKALKGAVQSVSIQDTSFILEGATLANGVLTIPAAAFQQEGMPSGNLTLVVTTTAMDCTISGEFIWVINTQDELYAMKSHLVVADDGKTYTGSLALGADINPGSGYLNITTTVKFFEDADVFAGTFDGRGYTLYKIFAKVGKNALFSNVSGTIKNLKLETCYVQKATAALVGNILTGTVENVYIRGTIQDDGLATGGNWTYQGCGLLAGQIKKGASIKNCIVDVVEIKEAGQEVGTAFGKLNAAGMTEAVFENCYAVNASGAAYMIINGQAGDKYDFALDANGNFATMADLWADADAAALATALGLTQ